MDNPLELTLFKGMIYGDFLLAYCQISSNLVVFPVYYNDFDFCVYKSDVASWALVHEWILSQNVASQTLYMPTLCSFEIRKF